MLSFSIICLQHSGCIKMSWLGLFWSSWHKLEASQKRNLHWENTSIRMAYRHNWRSLSWFMVDMGRPGLLRMVPPPARWSWIVQKTKAGWVCHEEQQIFPGLCFCSCLQVNVWASALISLHRELWLTHESQINPFSTRLLMMFIIAVETKLEPVPKPCRLFSSFSGKHAIV